jgi:hypothetical protein
LRPETVRHIEHPVDLLFLVWSQYHSNRVLTVRGGHADEQKESPK